MQSSTGLSNILKNKLIKNFTYFDLGKKREFKCSSQRASNVKLYFSFPFNYHKEDHITWKSATKAMLQNLQGGGGGGAIRVCRGQGSHCKLKIFSIFTMGPRSSRGLWGHAPPENFEN